MIYGKGPGKMEPSITKHTMAATREAAEPRTLEETLEGQEVISRPGHTFAPADAEYFRSIRARVDTAMVIEEDPSSK